MKKIIAFSVVFAPFITFAQTSTDASTFNNLIQFLKDSLQTATVLILAAAVVFFLWNVFKFVMAAGDEEERKKGRDGIIYGIIGIAVMVSVYGLVTFLTKSTGLGGQGTLTPPSLSI